MLGFNLSTFFSLFVVAAFPLLVNAQCGYNQCYGTGWGAPGGCCQGWTCTIFGEFYGQCTPSSAGTTPATTTPKPTTTTTTKSTTTTTTTKTTTGTANQATQTLWGQCSGNAWPGPTVCETGSYCYSPDTFYGQCVPKS